MYQSGVNNGGTGVPFTRRHTVVVRNTPVRSGEALNQDLGHLRAGLVDAEAADGERRPPLRER